MVLQSHLLNGIPVLHRFSGGGTVYHDLGNLNITFCKPRYPSLNSNQAAKEGKYITEVIKNAIATDEYNFIVDDRNGVYVNGEKILGSAIALKKEKFLYHASHGFIIFQYEIDHFYIPIHTLILHIFIEVDIPSFKTRREQLGSFDS